MQRRRLFWVARRVVANARRSEFARIWRIWRDFDLRAVRVEPSRYRRALNAARSLAVDPPITGPIWAVSMVKNEADIIGETISNLWAQGVDYILVADNGSSDESAEIMRAAGAIVVSDPIPEYWQGHKVTHLTRAAVRNGASWIIPFDADELWKGTGGRTIGETLRSNDLDIVPAAWFNFIPIACSDAPSFAERFPWREPAPDNLDKVAFRANWLSRVATGNHAVFTPGGRHERLLRVAHYRFRSAAQMLRKANDGAAAARLAGLTEQSLPQWYTLAGLDEGEAQGRLRALAEREGLTFDPAAAW